jgi:hypothetical protein
MKILPKIEELKRCSGSAVENIGSGRPRLPSIRLEKPCRVMCRAKVTGERKTFFGTKGNCPVSNSEFHDSALPAKSLTDNLSACLSA